MRLVIDILNHWIEILFLIFFITVILYFVRDSITLDKYDTNISEKKPKGIFIEPTFKMSDYSIFHIIVFFLIAFPFIFYIIFNILFALGIIDEK